jgi:hypothetical protein
MVLGGIIAGHGRVLGARDGLFGQVHLRQRGHMDEFVRNASLEQTELLADQHPQFRRVIDEGRGHMDRACVGCGGRLRFYPHELDDAAGADAGTASPSRARAARKSRFVFVAAHLIFKRKSNGPRRRKSWRRPAST